MEKINKNEDNYENDLVFENETMVGVRADNLKKNILVGSYIIIPKSQVQTPFELSNEEWLDTRKMMIEIKEYLDKKYKPDGYNLGWNVGKAGGQNIGHAHFHIIPRYNDEPYAGKGIRFLFKKDENIRKKFTDV
ncbi:MAG: HIT domain-containing protein [Bacilli bacterium]|nr:HIT domain-containing protein [Bacilli bacterium]